MNALAALLIAAGIAIVATPAAAVYPDRPIRLIVPQAAGSATDTLARLVAATAGPELGQTIVVEDRPGGALTLGLDLLAKSAPDGYTIGMGPIGALAITRHMVAKLPYDIERDFQPIALVTHGHLLLAVSPELPVHSVKELIAYAKAHPGVLNNASSSIGSPGHVGAELFKFMTDTKITHVPYKGGADAIKDLIGGRVQVMFESLNSIAPYARNGQVRALAVSGRRARPASPTCRPSPKPACPIMTPAPGAASSRRPGCRNRSSTSSTPPSTAGSPRNCSPRSWPASATSPPGARPSNSPPSSRAIRRCGARSCSASD